MKPKIYITRRIPDSALSMLNKNFEIKMWDSEDVPVPRETLMREIEEVDGIFTLLTEQIDREILNGANNLKIIANMAVGYNNIDVEEAESRNIVVTNTPGVLTETTADLTFLLMMATGRRLIEANNYLRNGDWQTWSPMQLTGQDIHGANLGIIGMGRIAQGLVKRAKGFDMNIKYYNRSRKPDIEKTYDIDYASLEEIYRTSDFVCLLLPYKPELHHMIGAEELASMKDSAILINTARGGLIDEEALYSAIKDNEIRGAGLDVFEKEPVSLDHPLLSLQNVVTLPHIGSASISTRTKMAELTAENLVNVLVKETAPLTSVNKV